MKALSPLGWLYGIGSSFRNALYDRGILSSHKLGARTISVGNLTAGGTGKTPLVAHIALLLAENGDRVCVLTRGYGRKNPAQRVVVSDGHKVLVDAHAGGDEPVELARKLIGKAVIMADRDRVAAARWAMQEFSPTVFVLDDGFQHRSAARDLDIVCIDATNPFGNDRFLPAGRLRESSSNLKRAHAAVLTRADLAHDLTGLETRVRDLAPQIEIFHARYTFRGFTELGSQKPVDTSEISSRPVYAFCGLGDPENFFSQLAKQGLRSVGNRAFPDHHFYTDADVRQIDSDASEAGADLLITTAKDAVRLETRMPTMRCLIAEIEIEITDDDLFRRLIFSF